MEAIAKLKEGQKFNEVASAYSEDKARQGVRYLIHVGKGTLVYISQIFRGTWVGCPGVPWLALFKKLRFNLNLARWHLPDTQILQ